MLQAMKKPTTIHRNQLYKEIWKEPASKVADRYGISGSMIARVCKALNVPRPERGYWAKLKHGHKVEKPPLPELERGQKHRWQINTINVSSQKDVSVAKEAVAESILDPEVERILTAELEEHRAVRDTRKALKKQKPDQCGVVSPRRKWKHLRVDVSEEQLERALTFLNRFLHLCENQGLKVACKISKNPAEETDPYSWRHDWVSGEIFIQDKDLKLSFSLRELELRVLSKEKPKQAWESRNYESISASGKLEFILHTEYKIGGQTRWKDGKIKRIEDSLEMMPCQVVNHFEAERKAKERERLREIQRKEEEEQRRFVADFNHSRDTQKTLEDKTVSRLTKEANGLAQVDALRRYIEACDHRVLELQQQGVEISTEDQLRLRWMKARLDMLDPFVKHQKPWAFIPKTVFEGTEPEGYWW